MSSKNMPAKSSVSINFWAAMECLRSGCKPEEWASKESLRKATTRYWQRFLTSAGNSAISRSAGDSATKNSSSRSLRKP